MVETGIKEEISFYATFFLLLKPPIKQHMYDFSQQQLRNPIVKIPIIF